MATAMIPDAFESNRRVPPSKTGIVSALSSSLRVARLGLLIAFVAGLAGVLSPNASAQSLWDQLKAQAQKAKQQATTAAQPATAARPGQPAAAAKPGRPAAVAANNGTGPFTPPAGTGIVPTVVGPFYQGSQFVISPQGVHVATLTNSGSRWVINYDGVEGPKFDQVFGQSSGMAGVKFSPDGNHYAYCALSGNEYVVMADGKEIFRDSKTNVQGSITDASCAGLTFSANSKHVYFTSSSRPGNSSSDAISFVWDGHASPLGADGDYRNYGFSPDGNHFAYIWYDPSNPTGSQKLIVDGKPVSYFGEKPQWSPDSEHLYVTHRISGARPEVDILLDGKTVMRADDITLYLPATGNLGIARITKISGTPNPYQFLVIGGKEVPGSNPGRSGIGDIHFSADGKHYASIFVDNNGHQSIFSDGKRGQTYTRVDPFTVLTQGESGPQPPIAFTGDGSKVVYVGDNASGLQFLVIGDEESAPIRNLTFISIAPVGNHVLAAGPGQLELDGKMLPAVPGQIYEPLMGPDGTHYAFATRAAGAINIYLDGVQQTAYGAIEANQTIYTFSPDGKHIAYFCTSTNSAAGNDVGVCLDGKYTSMGPAGGSLMNLTFSADSNHLFWIRHVGGSGFRMYADGKPVLDGGLPSVAGFQKEAWQTDGNSGMVILTQDGASFKRVSITPSSSSSLAMMLGSDPTMASKQ